jgi:hypothetical protein
MARSRIFAVGGAVAALAILVGGIWAWRQASAYAAIGGTYIAKQYCSCLFVTGRGEASCRAELQPDIGKFTIAVDRSRLPATAGVSARLMSFEGRASYAEGYGCTVSK